MKTTSIAAGMFLSTLFSGLSQTISWDGGGDGVSWQDPLNWSGDAVPGATNDVVINVPGEITVVCAGPDITIRSLQCEESLTVSVNLALSEGASYVNGAFRLDPGRWLTVQGSSTTFTAGGATLIDTACLSVKEGAVLSLPNVGSYRDPRTCCGQLLWEAVGAGSALKLPGLTNMSGGLYSVRVQALEGGRVELGGLTRIPGAVAFLADGTNSLVDLSSLSEVNSMGTLEARNGGTIPIPQLVDGNAVSVTLRLGGTIPTAQLTRLAGIWADGVAVDASAVTNIGAGGFVKAEHGGSVNLSNVVAIQGCTITVTGGGAVDLGRVVGSIYWSVLTLEGGSLSLESVTNLDVTSLSVRGGGRLVLPNVGSYRDTRTCCGQLLWEAVGAGSALKLPGLTNMSGGLYSVRVQALEGGRVELGGLTRIPGAVAFLADGTNSLVDLSSLSEVNSMGTLEARNGGTIPIPQLVDGNAVSVTLRPGGTIPTAQLTRLAGIWADGVNVDLNSVTRIAGGGVVLDNGGTVNLSGVVQITGSALRVNYAGTLRLESVTNIDVTSLSVAGGGLLSLPNVRTFRDPRVCCGALAWEASGPGAVLDLSGMTNLFGASTYDLQIRALNGGRVDLSGTTAIRDGGVAILSDGAGSFVDLSSLTEFAGVRSVWHTGNSSVESRNGAVVRLNATQTRVSAVTINLTPNGMIEVGTLELGIWGLLAGTGVLAADVINGAQVRSGTALAGLTISGDYTQTASGNLYIDSLGTAPDSGFNPLRVTGAITLGGTITLDARFPSSLGDAFVILSNLTNAPIIGTFSGLPQNHSLGGGGMPFVVFYTGGNGNDVMVMRPLITLTTLENGQTQIDAVGHCFYEQYPTALAPGSRRLTGVGRTNRSYSIRATSDFGSWQTLVTLNADSSGLLHFLDTEAASIPWRFYTIVSTNDCLGPR